MSKVKFVEPKTLKELLIEELKCEALINSSKLEEKYGEETLNIVSLIPLLFNKEDLDVSVAEIIIKNLQEFVKMKQGENLR